eukprot:CAMPEP_0170620810 /NCGR_PEP_ID=MMETSP0224-20130122/28262_1 /TAXON_ID=285029 /ORGANISM="Togula jolla, Strain CCCM 725" /LENGTH=198 /DNA_ID=CAMNT_0010947019 /DNA_START=70 /DNA_END=667 /DNA_ORIENTATION=+
MVFEVFEDREYDTRGFAMRRGHRSRLLPAQVGRNKFKISTSSGRDIARCGMCRPGRHHGAGGAKAYKKVNPDARAQWQRVLGEARHAELAGSGALEPESDQLAGTSCRLAAHPTRLGASLHQGHQLLHSQHRLWATSSSARVPPVLRGKRQTAPTAQMSVAKSQGPRRSLYFGSAAVEQAVVEASIGGDRGGDRSGSA